MTLTEWKKSKASGVRPYRLPNTAPGKDSFSSLPWYCIDGELWAARAAVVPRLGEAAVALLS